MVSPAIAPPPSGYRFSSDEFYRMVELGWFVDKRVELIDGEVLEMPAQSNEHALSITLTADVLKAVYGSNFWVRVQMPLDLSPHSVPDPDVAVIAGSPRSNSGRKNPATAVLVVEVSESTLSGDRNRKSSLYAASGIPEYWIVNLVNRQLEVRRDPRPDPSSEFGSSYASLDTVPAGGSTIPLSLPTANVAVDDLLP